MDTQTTPALGAFVVAPASTDEPPYVAPYVERLRDLGWGDWRDELREIAGELLALTATDVPEWGVILTRTATENDSPAARALGYVLLPGAARPVSYARARELAALATGDPRSTVSYAARVAPFGEMQRAVAGYQESVR